MYGLRLVGLVQASQPFTNGSLGGSQHVVPEQLREVVYAAASSALQCVVFDAAVLGSRQGTGAVACCRQSGHCRALHEGVIVEVTSMNSSNFHPRFFCSDTVHSVGCAWDSVGLPR